MNTRCSTLIAGLLACSALAFIGLGIASASKATVEVLAPQQADSFGGVATCIGNCTGDQRRGECDSSKATQFCSDFKTSTDCCYAIRSRSNVHECFGDGSADCYSYGESTCYIYNYCGWDGDKCYSDGCNTAKEDEQQCI